MPKLSTRGRPLFVHLGNVGDKPAATKTRRYAKRFPNAKFIGIDNEPLRYDPGLKNWRQIKANFKDGLKKLSDNSANVISSELALGCYDRRADLASTLQIAHEKLKNGGKLMLVVEESDIPRLREALAKTPFARGKIKIRKLNPVEYLRTYTIRWLGKARAKIPNAGSLYQLIAKK